MLLFAHRGSHDRQTSENTIAAFERAVERGCDGIEFDLRISRDGVPVAVHDENLHRVAGDARRVRDLASKELRDVVLRGHGHIPTLNEITASIPAPTLFDIEVKDRDVLEILIKKLQTSAGLRQRTIVSSFVLDDLVQIAKTLPEVRTLLLQRSWPLLFRKRVFSKQLSAAKVWAVGFPRNVLNARRIRWVRRKGWAVAAWDLQPLKREARRVAKLGVDIAIVYKVETIREKA
ncbi:hypothetical protein HY479_00935 [Candidatus Uhrbacteria bacterium]|nr:hypothetical protein [Candidatus Uhrbacteria bacterium]